MGRYLCSTLLKSSSLYITGNGCHFNVFSMPVVWLKFFLKFFFQGEYHDAIKEHQNELQISDSLNDIIGAAVANRKIGECYNELGQYQKALKHQRKHLRLAESSDNVLEQQRALATIGRTYLCWADNPDTDSAEKTEVLPEAQSAFQRSGYWLLIN